MAPNSLFSSSISSSPLSLSHKLGNPFPCLVFKTHPHKPTLITCKTTDSETQRQRPISEPHVSIPNIELEGTGTAATTRGQLFLERQQSMAAAALVLASEKKKKKGKKSPKLSSAIACCYGCGAPLQTSEVDAPGYVNLETYELKKKHRQLKTVLCGRCRLLSHGHMVTAVGGNGGYSGGKQFISAEELREKLSHLRHEKALIIKLVDIVDFNGSFLTRIRDLAGANPIILVVTKVDLLPKGTNLNCIGDWVVEATMKKKLNVLSVHLTSSKSLVGIAGVASDIQKEKKGRDVYILGSANVGKSAFINALLKMMAEKDPVAAAARKYKPIQSAVPGTTLGPIQIDAFVGGKLFDTPGVHLHHKQAAVIHSEDLPALAPRSRLRGQSFPVTSHERNGEIKGNGLNGYSLFWGGLVRIDVLKVHPLTHLTFYGPKALQIHMREVGVLLTPPTGKQSADNWAGLQTVQELQIKIEDQKRPACDVAISGLGWITVEPINKLLESSDLSSPEEYAEQLHLAVHVPKPVEIFVRPSIPVGKTGEEWYEYRDLTEKEEELRPKWYF
ncbi:NO-associated protein 1, chloroplastic/mitochondrial isoform X2 [Telopea speciosissima]|uniref:NO-associated protein 1, chloroplastic/mitochondrial isoform X2 n=1 Tax=Telopea speciosissima TaxID=54955 RepID=UPI001CC5FC0C|nr:NO-associated protein 1, chloroplastic/mitochondrial isoform X2 [Telopea speciosissima]